MGKVMRYIKKRTKDDWTNLKRETSNAKKELSDIATDAKKEWKDADISGSWKQTGDDIKKDLKSSPTLSETFREEKEKRQRKEAAYNPSGFTRIITAASVFVTSIIAILLIPTIIGIPIAAIIFGVNVWAWRKYVTKKPEKY